MRIRNSVCIMCFFLLMFPVVGCDDRGDIKVKNIENFKELKYGSSFEELQKQIGKPDRYEGKNLRYAVYDLESGNYAQVFSCKDKIQQVYIFDGNNENIYTMFDEMKNQKIELSDKICIIDQTIYYNKDMCNISIEDFKAIDDSYDYNDLVLAVGQPVDYIGYGELCDLYILKDGTIVTLQPFYGDRSFGNIIHYKLENNRLEMLEQIK